MRPSAGAVRWRRRPCAGSRQLPLRHLGVRPGARHHRPAAGGPGDRRRRRPIAYLESLQNPNGSFPSLIPAEPRPDVDSTALAVMALALAPGSARRSRRHRWRSPGSPAGSSQWRLPRDGAGSGQLDRPGDPGPDPAGRRVPAPDPARPWRSWPASRTPTAGSTPTRRPARLQSARVHPGGQRGDRHLVRHSCPRSEPGGARTVTLPPGQHRLRRLDPPVGRREPGLALVIVARSWSLSSPAPPARRPAAADRLRQDRDQVNLVIRPPRRRVTRGGTRAAGAVIAASGP